MPRDAHRSPSRLADPRLSGRLGSQSIQTNGSHSPAEVIAEPIEEEPFVPSNGYHHAGPELAYFDDPGESEVPYLDTPPPPSRSTPPPERNKLSAQERHELLMHTIALYDDEWKLAGIRAKEEANRLTAYLTPRTKKWDLKTAMAKKQVLVIKIDNQGNTDIVEPQQAGLWGRLTAWLFGG
jgi:hypothetical protein